MLQDEELRKGRLQRKRSEPTVSDSGSRRAEREEKNHQKTHNFQFHENEHLFYSTTGLTENIVYSCPLSLISLGV
ncbi:hypothetical protein Acr_15g0007460 [Actinidia rufa]|uniref:Uncharacterized protein n=1 Tax=Actinidia rufa TaxID=165716 RepID=A0A7J0FUM5_9ERIC|nr:hypothetical protein Acr_15g0007460 [Actinidia rufa]